MPTPEYTDMITPTLVINKLTKAQYETIANPSDTELYLVPDDDLREHRSYYTTGTATVDGETVDVDIMYEGVAPEGSVETDAVWTITTIVATLDGNVLSNDVDTDQTWDFPTPTPVVPVIDTRPPILYPTTASDIKSTSMVVKSSISDNGKILTENGFVYNTIGNPTVSDTKVICDLGVGFFEKKLENLIRDTEYHIKSYGQNSSGLVYGSELVQSTLPSPIPVEYQLVEYLESSGTQYIDTQHRINSNIFEFHVKFMKYGSNLGYPIGNLGNVTNERFEFYTNGTQFNVLLATNIITNYNGGVIDATLVCNTNNELSLYYDNFVYSGTFNSAVISNTNTIWIGKRHPNASSAATSGKIYHYSYKENGVYLRNMYPVYRIADDKPGMYDIVNGVFYVNQGTGEFTVGPDKDWDE